MLRTGNGRKQTVTVTARGASGAAHTVLQTRLGKVTVVREEGALTGLYFPRHWPRPDRTAFGPRADEGLEDIARQLGEYLGRDRKVFELPVGAAVGRNPLCIVIPCHRVVGSTGKLTGYAGGLDRKRTLLEIEQGPGLNPAVIDELAAPDVRFEYSLHAPLRGRDAVRAFAGKFCAAFPDLNFWGTADLIAEGDYVVGRWEGGGTHTGDAFNDMPIGSLPANTGKVMRFTGTTVPKVENGLITEEIGLDDGRRAQPARPDRRHRGGWQLAGQRRASPSYPQRLMRLRSRAILVTGIPDRHAPLRFGIRQGGCG